MDAGIKGVSHKPLGSIVLVKPITDRLGVGEIIDRYVPMERERVDGLSRGQVIEALVANRLSAPRPLYRVEEWAGEYAVGEVYGVEPGRLNDDRVGRALDAIYPHLEELKGELAMRAITEFEQRQRQGHKAKTRSYMISRPSISRASTRARSS